MSTQSAGIIRDEEGNGEQWKLISSFVLFFLVSLAPLGSILDTNLIEKIDENLFSNLRHLQLL